MNNDQFRRLLAPPNSTSKSPSTTTTTTAPGSKPNAPSKQPPPATATLGSRLKSSIPMTPRSVRAPGSSSSSSSLSGGGDFLRQLAERNGNAAASGTPAPGKGKPKTSAPKGSKLASGYSDRAALRRGEQEASAPTEGEREERARRIAALEEEVKMGRMGEEEFERVRDRITNGEVANTHLVRGLDRRLLERVRRGEDVYTAPPAPVPAVVGGDGKGKEGEGETVPRDEDDEFDELERQEIRPVARREETLKKGEVAPKRQSRDEILAALKASRRAAKEAAKPKLGPGFKPVIKPGARVEIDERGREVMIVTDKDGNVKRKVRKGQGGGKEESNGDASGRLLEVDASVAPLGMVVPDRPPTPPEPEIENIFDDVPEYDPLAGLSDSSDSEDNETSQPAKVTKPPDSNPTPNETNPSTTDPKDPSQSPSSPPSNPPPQSLPRNYFGPTADPSLSVLSSSNPLSTNPDLIANLLAKSRHIDPARLSGTAGEANPSNGDGKDSTSSADAASRLKRKAAMLATRDRDLDDMDLGFGGSRFDDAEEMELEEGGRGPKLAEWRGLGGGGDDEDGDGDGERGGKKRKRGPKKKGKGDKNSADSVMKLVESRKAGS